MPVADEVRTVFITGFPEDVRERELNNMLRFLPGYEVRPRHARQWGAALAPGVAQGRSFASPCPLLHAAWGPTARLSVYHRIHTLGRIISVHVCMLCIANARTPSRPFCAPCLQASQMHFRNGQAQGFALFASGSLARAAVDAIQNLVFDNDSVLRAEMAHKNM